MRVVYWINLQGGNSVTTQNNYRYKIEAEFSKNFPGNCGQLKPFGAIVHRTQLFNFNSGGVIIGVMTPCGTHFIHKTSVFHHFFEMGELFSNKSFILKKVFEKLTRKLLLNN